MIIHFSIDFHPYIIVYKCPKKYCFSPISFLFCPVCIHPSYLYSICKLSIFILNVKLSGCLPNIARNSIVNCSELVTYDIIKELILKRGLMTGECRHLQPPRPITITHFSSSRSFVTGAPVLFWFGRQHAVSLHRSLRGGFLHHHRGVSGGRGENPLHELSAGPVQRGCELCPDHADEGGTHGFL